MKICFTIPSLDKGGAERVISNLSNYLIEKNEVFIIVNKRNISYELNKKIKVIELDKTRDNNSILRNIKRINKMGTIINKNKFDVVIGFLPLPSFRLLFLKPFIKSKIIISDRNNPEMEYNTLIKKTLMKWLYKRADGFVFQTNEQKNYFSNRIRMNSTVIANPIKEEFINVKSEIKKEEIIITVGRFVEQKNHLLLLEAFSEVVKKHPNYILKIFGDGELKNNYNEFIKKNNLQHKIYLCGISDNIKNELLKSKIFVLSSDFEGMPNSLMEAMACGNACISTNCPCGGPSELIDNGKNGILIPIKDKKQMELKMNELIENDEKIEEIGKNAKNISKNFNPKVINSKWEEYIKKIVDKGK